MAELNDRFHRGVLAAAQNPVLDKAAEGLWGFQAQARQRLLRLPGWGAESAPQHRRVARAIAAREADEAEAAMREHLVEVRTSVLRRLERARRPTGKVPPGGRG